MTGDDFGLSVPINEAIADAHQKGILTTTSLMVAAPAAADAVSRARSLPTLNVGLHLVLVGGRPCLPPENIPGLVDETGSFSSNQVSNGMRMFFLPGVRRQLEAEIRAQFEAFAQTGLRLDHVNAHKHMHLHPTVLDLIITVGRDYGLKAVRLPNEPPQDVLIYDGKEKIRRYSRWLFFKPWLSIMQKRLRGKNIRFNDYVYGLHDSGHMNQDNLIRILSNLPEGVSEIYTHPATGAWDGMDPAAADYEYEAEYKALIHPRVRRVIEKFSIELSGFSDIH